MLRAISLNSPMTNRFLFLFLTISMVGLSMPAAAQTTGRLYDPEPPMDSGYVRVIVAAQTAPVDVLVDGQKRVRKLVAAELGEYMVLAEGKHTITLSLFDKPEALLSKVIEVVRGKSVTLAVTSIRKGAAIISFEDKGNTNKLKSVLTAYNLDPKAESLDILTGDGNTKVFGGLAYGAMASIQVNPILVDLVVTNAGGKVPMSRTSLEMHQGATYSVLLLGAGGGKTLIKTVQNRAERYTGK
jgi:hypothetical protein